MRTAEGGWLKVSEGPPPRDSWVHVWHGGRIALAKYNPQYGVPAFHDWLLLPPGKLPFSPFPSHEPKWWRPQPDPPLGVVGSDDPFPEARGEEIVRWRGSTSDLATDLKSILSLEEREKLCVELVYLSQTSDAPPVEVDNPQPASSASPSPPLPIPMLLYCPECNERHVDRGQFATKHHHTHSCQFCGMTWRPAVVDTVGVQFLPGFKSEESPVSFRAPALSRRDVIDAEPDDFAWPPSPPAMCSRCLRVCGKIEDHAVTCPERTF